MAINIHERMADYVDKHALVNPSLPAAGCDNGVLFTAEYLANMAKHREVTLYDSTSMAKAVRNCFAPGYPGCLRRYPGCLDQDGPDNHYGVALIASLIEPELAQDVIGHWFKTGGFSNSRNPSSRRDENGKINWRAFLVRQPQLVFAMFMAADTGGFLSYVRRFFLFPFELVAAGVIATSCIGVPTGSTDERLLSWCLIQTVSPKSWLCRQAAKLWYKRLAKDYPHGMRDVASIYFGAFHPLADYWVD